MMLEEHLSQTVSDHLGAVPVPPPDLDGVRRRGTAVSRRRTTTGLVAAAAGVGLVLGVAVLQDGVDEPTRRGVDQARYGSVDQLDYAHGLRAVASPDGDEILLGSQRLRVSDVPGLGNLDTDASATAYGLLHFDDDARVHLLQEDGSDTVLAEPSGSNPDFRPSSKADSSRPLVAFTQPADGAVEVVLHDLEQRRAVDTLTLPCSDMDCEEIRVDAVSEGLVFVRTRTATHVWDPSASGDTRWTLLGEGKFRVADAQNRRILWSDGGPPPTPAPGSPVADWKLTEGAIDAQLTLDGGHVLYWNRVLKPSTPNGKPVRLDVRGAVWFTVDTDGSILAAVPSGMRAVIHDCEIPSGRCTEVGSVATVSGDPVFIGNDM